MICSCAGAIGGLGTNLVSRNKNVDATVCACGGDVRPSSIFVAIGKSNAPRAVALCNDGSAARFVIFDRLVLTTAEFKSDASEEASMWVLTAPFFLFKDSVLFSIESDNLIKNPTIIRRLGQK
jgi:hypothetical protein